MSDEDKDYYAVLGVPESATEEQIRQAYHRQARRYHPDTRKEGASTELFYELQRAYAVLSDPSQRHAYDLRRRGQIAGNLPFYWKVTLSRKQLWARHAEQVVYALIEIQPALVRLLKCMPLNLCLVLDRSTSMGGPRLDHTKSAVRQIVDVLSPDDALALVAFNDRAEVLLPTTTGVTRSLLRAKLESVQANGGTEILSGLRTGLAELGKRCQAGITSHLILLTDGRTYGDEEACVAEAEQAGERGIAVTAFGIGPDWNERLLDELAIHSGGLSAYIAEPEQTEAFLRRRVQALKAVCAQRLRLVLESTSNMRVERVYRVFPSLGRLDTVGGATILGTLDAFSLQTVLIELAVHVNRGEEQPALQIGLSAEVMAPEVKEISLHHTATFIVTPAEPPLEPVPKNLVRALQKVTLYRMQEDAWEILAQGQVAEATQRLQDVATRLLELGEKELAQVVLVEAGRICEGQGATATGRKRIRYGTRYLALGAGEVGVEGQRYDG